MIELRSVTKIFDGTKVLDDVSLSVKKGEAAVLIGPSGGGKSTLLRCINGLEKYERGTIEVTGRSGMVFQQFHLFENMNVLENVASGPRFVLGKTDAEARRIARRYLDRVDLAAKADAAVSELSGGQQQRVAIARTLAAEPEVILFDEPTSALDPHMAAEVMQVIAELRRAGQTMLIVTHAIGFAERIADVVSVMYGGRIVESGSPAQIFSASASELTRTFLAEAA